MLNRLLAGLVETSRRHALLVMLAGFLLAVLAGGVAATRLGVSTDTDKMFSEKLPWRRNAIAIRSSHPSLRGP